MQKIYKRTVYGHVYTMILLALGKYLENCMVVLCVAEARHLLIFIITEEGNEV